MRGGTQSLLPLAWARYRTVYYSTVQYKSLHFTASWGHQQFKMAPCRKRRRDTHYRMYTPPQARLEADAVNVAIASTDGSCSCLPFASHVCVRRHGQTIGSGPTHGTWRKPSTLWLLHCL
jgi:hypothetical protein